MIPVELCTIPYRRYKSFWEFHAALGENDLLLEKKFNYFSIAKDKNSFLLFGVLKTSTQKL